MYCKHCYRMMEDGADICPSCGKSQRERAKKPMNKVVRVLLGVAVWFGTMLLCAIIGTILGLPNTEGLLAKFYSLCVVIVPVVVAFKVAAPEKTKFSAPPKQIQAKPDPIPEPTVYQKKADQDEKVKTMASDITKALHENSIRQLYGDEFANLILQDNEPAPPSSRVVSGSDTSSVVAKTHRVTGLQHYMDNILNLATENPDYDMSKKEILDCGMEDEKIWKYEFYPSKTELVPEPNNPHDPNAIKVVVDGEHVGYIKAKSCAHLHNVISAGRLRGIDCEIGGGPYKTVYEEMDDDTYENVYKVERGETNIFVHLTVYEEKK